MKLISVLMAASLIVLCELPAYAQDVGLKQAVSNDPTLEDTYGRPCTSVNGIEFSSLPRPDLSLQESIDHAEDGGTVELPPGYLSLNTPLNVDKNVTIVGDQVSVIDARHNCELLNVEDPSVTVTIKNIVLANGKGEMAA